MSLVSKGAGIELEIYQLLSKTFILLDDSDTRFFAEYGLSTRQFWALQHLDEVNGRSMVDLSRLLFTDKSNVTGIIDRLEHLKLVKRVPSTHDRRVTLIMLTTEGSHLREKVDEQHGLRIFEVMKVLNTSQLQMLYEYLTSVSQSIEKELMQVETGQ
ncbi:MarR family transcriptional regulator [Dictyobacter alpinus]|uniref:MarR family transcriptional regulator n=1 Tax=Dictyobacter alpinus TaxID=2014873 RepID=A0A402B634_9CHLR|nr:MarR family transcriptional regulator [Dictyobacter alpinus]GCE26808.1 MarR family transcriptional regulator [Dictyobacter alpinus]